MKYFFLLIALSILAVFPGHSQNLSDTSGAVSLKTAADNTYICPDKKELYLYVDLAASSASKRIPLNICLVLDRSGSMAEEERLHNAKIAVNYLIDHLNPDDICAIVIYDHIAEVVHGATTVTDKEHLKKKIRHISPGGHTNIYMGLQLGYQEVKVNYSPDKINRVILLSDGLANEGITDDYMMEMIVRDHFQKENISLSTFGMGHEFNEKLMHDMAEYGGGNYYFVERPAEAINDFGAEIKMLTGIVAKNAILKIQYPSSSLKTGHVFGSPYISSPNNIIIDLKEVHPGEQHGILVKFHSVPPQPDSLTFTTTLSYIDAQTNRTVTKTNIVRVQRSEEAQDCHQGFNRDVIDKVALFSSNYYLDSATNHAERGDYAKAHETLESAKKLNAGARPDDPQIKQQAQLVEDYQTELRKAQGGHPNNLKILHKRVRHQNYKIRKFKK